MACHAQNKPCPEPDALRWTYLVALHDVKSVDVRAIVHALCLDCLTKFTALHVASAANAEGEKP